MQLLFLDITHVLLLCKTHNVSETAFCLRLQVEPTQLGQIYTTKRQNSVC
jgi:hypothetical protein